MLSQTTSQHPYFSDGSIFTDSRLVTGLISESATLYPGYDVSLNIYQLLQDIGRESSSVIREQQLVGILRGLGRATL